MKVLLISVGRLPWYRKDERLHFFYTPRMGLPHLAAVTPKNWDVAILDGISADELDYDEAVDLVGFSVLTPFANETYTAAGEFRRRGVKVVMGGPHATLAPKEAMDHADAVVVGEGEEIWPRLLNDFAQHRLQRQYIQDKPVDFAALPPPDYSLIRNGDYAVANGMQLVRGCPYGKNCKFCIVPKLFGTSYRVLPVEEAVRRIRTAQESGKGPVSVNCSACCALNHTEYIRSFAEAVRPLGIRWSGGALLEKLQDAKLISLLKASGCECVYTESAVTSDRKDPVKNAIYVETAKKLFYAGINISYNFTIGFDDDGPQVIDEVMDFIEKGKLNKEMCAIQIFAPWPNTPTRLELEQAGRIIDRNWSHYDNMRVVFTPRLMTAEAMNSLCGR